jgi:hypothetical protein
LNAIVIYTPTRGEISGKLAAFDVLMKAGIQTDYTLSFMTSSAHIQQQVLNGATGF